MHYIARAGGGRQMRASAIPLAHAKATVFQHVLLLDPDQAFRSQLATCLRSAGFAVREGEDGRAVSTTLTPAEVLIVEMLMPETDGVEAILKARALWPEVAVVATTAGCGALQPDYLLSLALHLGADAAVSKPAPTAAFCTAIKEIGARRGR